MAEPTGCSGGGAVRQGRNDQPAAIGEAATRRQGRRESGTVPGIGRKRRGPRRRGAGPRGEQTLRNRDGRAAPASPPPGACSTTVPPYNHEDLVGGLGDQPEIVPRRGTSAMPVSRRARPSRSRICAWIVTSSARPSARRRRAGRGRRRAPWRSSRAGAGRPKADADRRRPNCAPARAGPQRGRGKSARASAQAAAGCHGAGAAATCSANLCPPDRLQGVERGHRLLEVSSRYGRRAIGQSSGSARPRSSARRARTEPVASAPSGSRPIRASAVIVLPRLWISPDDRRGLRPALEREADAGAAR